MPKNEGIPEGIRWKMLQPHHELTLQQLEGVLRTCLNEPLKGVSEGQSLAVLPNDLSGLGVHLGLNQQRLENVSSLERQLDLLGVQIIEDIAEAFALEVARHPGAPAVFSLLGDDDVLTV